MKRRDFFKTATVAGLATFLKPEDALSAGLSSSKAPAVKTDMVAVMGGEPEEMLLVALKEMGGIGKFVKKGQKVVIKPNIGWDRKPELAANTNPDLIAALVKQCKIAGASQIIVFDHTCHDWKKSYTNSGIEAAVLKAGGKMVPGNDESYYAEVDLPHGVNLKKTKIHKSLLECDVWFNVPILKHHGGAKNTISMKNLMGIVWDRGFFHRNDLHQCIADTATFYKKPALNIVDAYRIMKSNGPQGKSEADVVTLKSLIMSPDYVAVDTAAMKMFSQVQPTDIKDVRYIDLAEKLKVGTQNLEKLNVKKIKL
ncbi:MAG: DUF362 domain-containing protein [Paludibacter sp.]|jgi:uncharacterized protein (DUF362 family)|nr:DUF362 domain-containing protein [Paludibacter sp.]